MTTWNEARPGTEVVEVCEDNRAQLLLAAALIGEGVPAAVAALVRKLEGSGDATLMALTLEECGLIEAAQRLVC